jgi:RimJ/RimL family protein N-acetyltransferase
MDERMYEIKFFTISEILKTLKMDNSLVALYDELRTNYLSTLSDRFSDETIENIIKNDKKYYKSIDDNTQIIHAVCYVDDKPIGLSRFMIFGDKILGSDFFRPLTSNLKIKRTPESKYIYFYGAYTAVKWRGKGVYGSILKAIILFCEKNNIKIIIMDVKDDNMGSIKVVTKTGFKKSSILSRKPDVFFYTYEINKKK